MNLMKEFFDTIPNGPFSVLDVGSARVSNQKYGTYRDLIKSEWRYTGADISKGDNVDVVLTDGYTWPFEDSSFDVVISGQTIEHVERPWDWFVEMARVMRDVCCVIAPAVIHEHRYPIDTFRYYPDGMVALAKHAGLSVVSVRRVPTSRGMEDTILIAKK